MILGVDVADLVTKPEVLVALLNMITAALALATASKAKKASEATPDKALIRSLGEERASSERLLKQALSSHRAAQRSLEKQLDALVDLLDRKL